MSKPLTRLALLLSAVTTAFLPLHAAEEGGPSTGAKVKPASDEGERAITGFQLPKGFKCELVAAEPLFANPVSFCIDEKGRFYIAETFRFKKGVQDIRDIMHWLDEELAVKTVEERVAYSKRRANDKGDKPVEWYTNSEDRVSLVWDSNGDGKADKSTVFAGNFSDFADGIGSGVLARRGDVYFTNIPELWLLKDANNDGIADVRKSLSHGYGVRFGFLGHDLHGLRIGPDGRLYFSIGDRGGYITLPNGKVIDNREAGAVYRCELDGSNLEIFHIGLRNPQELVFDDLGNLWTGDNNSDAGDPARIVYVAEGGDSGWRVGWQFIESPIRRSSWLGERLCYEHFMDRAAYCLPPVSSKVGNGPSGLTFDPGTSLPEEWKGRFFLCNFSGNPRSGIFSFEVASKGAGFELKDNKQFWWNFLPTDVDFGYDGCLYATDWVNGWSGEGKGRIYRLYEPAARDAALAMKAKELFAGGFTQRSTKELAGLLEHPDMRVRQEAQFALVEKKAESDLTSVAKRSKNLHARLHAVWGLGQLARGGRSVNFSSLLKDAEPEVRAQTAKVISDAKVAKYEKDLIKMLADEAPRARYFAALALSHIGKADCVPAVLAMLKENADQDPWIRHAGISALVTCAGESYLAGLVKDPSVSVRWAAAVGLRRLGSAQLAAFLNDADPRVVAEAARAINDLPIAPALPALAALAEQGSHFGSMDAGDSKTPTPRDAILRRVLNANLRIGGSAETARVAALASNDAMPENIRVEALTQLGNWPKPSGRDHVSGLWRPIADRPAPSETGLRPLLLKTLTANTQDKVQEAALETTAKLGWKSFDEAALALLNNAKAETRVRIAALNYLGETRSKQLEAAVELARNDSSDRIRSAASKYAGLVNTGNAAATLEAALDKGSLREKQAALAALGDLKDASADKVLGSWLDKLTSGKVVSELRLDLLEAAAKRSAGSTKQKLDSFEAKRPDKKGLGNYAECLTGGDADAGKKVFYEKLEASCSRCHKIKGEGGDACPDLTELAKRGDRNYILESIVFPNAKVAEGYETVIVNLKGGGSYSGILKKETGDALEFLSLEDGVVKIPKADVEKRTKGASGMPDNVRDTLSKREIRDVVEYLSGMR